jgi:hypothetical protein
VPDPNVEVFDADWALVVEDFKVLQR